MAKNNYYAVRVGRNPGIYTDWEECKSQVIGYKGAIYKGFVGKKEAEDFMNGNKEILPFIADESENGIKDNNKNECVAKNNKAEQSDAQRGLSAYVDGSFLKGNVVGCGCVIIYRGEIIAELSEKYEDEELASMRNVAGEIKAAELAMRYALDNGYDLITIFHDYQGIASWCLGEWKTNRTGTIAYKKFYDSIRDSLAVRFVKVKGHSGDEYNDMADKLAKKAIGIFSPTA